MGEREKATPVAWIEPIGGWSLSLSAAGRSRPTIATRTDHLRRLARAFPDGPWGVTADTLIAWAGGQDWARETRRSVYASVRSFYQWGVDAGRTEHSPADKLPPVRATRPSARPAPDTVYRSAQLGADGRLRLILLLAAELGLRRAEIAQVHGRDLAAARGGWELRVHGKGGRARVIPVGPELAMLIRSACLAGGGWAFPGDDHGHLSPRYVGVLASRALPGDWTLHTLRHRFASAVYAGSRDLLSVQQLLGHASPATTQRYVALPDDALRQAIRHAS